MRSVSLVRGFSTESPDFNCPEYTRIKVSWPTNGSAMILNASAENGSLSSALRRDDFISLLRVRPWVPGVSSGEGR